MWPFNKKKKDETLMLIVSEIRSLRGEMSECSDNLKGLTAAISNMAADWQGIADYTSGGQPVKSELDSNAGKVDGEITHIGASAVFKKIQPRTEAKEND